MQAFVKVSLFTYHCAESGHSNEALDITTFHWDNVLIFLTVGHRLIKKRERTMTFVNQEDSVLALSPWPVIKPSLFTLPVKAVFFQMNVREVFLAAPYFIKPLLCPRRTTTLSHFLHSAPFSHCLSKVSHLFISSSILKL